MTGFIENDGYIFVPPIAGGETYYLLQETGDAILQETNDYILTEDAV